MDWVSCICCCFLIKDFVAFLSCGAQREDKTVCKFTKGCGA